MATKTLDEGVLSLLNRMDAAERDGEMDSQSIESFERERLALREQAEAEASAREAAAESAQEEANEEAVENMHRITDKHVVSKAQEAATMTMADIYNEAETCLKKGVGWAMTIMPSVVSRHTVEEGMVPILRSEKRANPIEGAVKTGPNGVHRFVYPEVAMSAQARALYPTHQLSLVGEDGDDGKRTSKVYTAAPMDIGSLINTATGTGAAGAATIPGGTMYFPTPQLPRAFTGNMSDPSIGWDVKVTPGDINEMKVLQITDESTATHPAKEVRDRTQDPADSNPTTAEVTIGAGKIATNMSFTIESTMKNYIIGWERVFGRQGLHKHLRKVDEALTTGTGAGDPVQAKGIMTAAAAIAGIPKVSVPKAALDAFGIKATTYLRLRSKIKPGNRDMGMAYVFTDGVHHQAMIEQYDQTAPGYGVSVGNIFDITRADDSRGILGRVWLGLMVSNEWMSEDTQDSNENLGLYVNTGDWCTRTTGTTMSFNPSIYENLDQVGVFIRTWASGDFIHPQVSGEYSVAMLTSGA